MIYKIAIIGPESSGKTTLTQKLSSHFQEPYVKEFARDYLESTGGKYSKDDLKFIAEKQVELENIALLNAKTLLFCDTNPLVVKIWSNYKYGSCNERILTTVTNSYYDMQFLLKPDLPYEADPLREDPSLESRERLFSIYEDELIRANQNYSIIGGQKEDRFKNALKVLQSKFSL